METLTSKTPRRAVLLVEDCPLVRRACARSLSIGGYHVYEASFAEEALRLWARHRDDIDVVVSDVVMPGRTGRALVAELLQDRPDLRVVLMSAFPRHVLDARGLTCGEVPVLQKPFGPSRLLGMLASLF